MIRTALGRLFGHPIPYHSSLERCILKFSRGDELTIAHAVTGTQIFGGTGSGKTSGSGRALAHGFLKAGMGGLVLCAKPDEADRWRKLARECGRSRDLVFFDGSEEGLRFNFLDYAQATVASGGRDLNLVDIMSTIAEAARSQAAKGAGQGDNQFFRDAANQLLANAFPLLRIVHGTIRLRSLYEFINSAPTSRQEAYDPRWAKESYCGATLMKAHELGMEGNAEAARIAEEYGPYWTDEFPGLGDRTRGSVVTTLTSTLYPFLSGQLNDLFCTSTSIVPDYAREGIVIVCDLPARKFGLAGVVAQQIMKLLFQLAMEAEKVTARTRPVFIWADECQFFMNSHDADHLSVCRQQKVANVFITQDMPTYFAKIGDEYVAESLLNKFGTRIFHASTDARTCNYASEIVGKITHHQLSESASHGASSGGGDSIGEQDGSGSGSYGTSQTWQRSRSTYRDYDIPPHYFGSSLRTGGPSNRFKVDGIVIRNGGVFRSSGKNRIKAEFSQK